MYKPRPKTYLFESEQVFAAYHTRVIQQIFINAKNKAVIHKDIGIHSLRHSFAIHSLEKGTDIKYKRTIRALKGEPYELWKEASAGGSMSTTLEDVTKFYTALIRSNELSKKVSKL